MNDSWQSMLSEEQRRLFNTFIYSPETGEFRWKSNGRGHTKQSGGVAGSMHSRGYIRIKTGGQTYFGHRLAYLFMVGKWPDEEVDHINGVRTDNRWANLRAATAAENRRNSAGHPGRRRSPFKGVTTEHRSSRFKAQITINGRTHKLGHFDSEAEAAEAYRKAAVELHGEFAKW